MAGTAGDVESGIRQTANRLILRREAGPDLARIIQAPAIVIADQHRIEPGVRGLVASDDELLPAAYALGREIADNTAPVSVALNRQMIWKMLGADHPMEAHKVDSKGIYARGKSDDVKEGVTAFLEKRPAKFPMKVTSDMPSYFPWWQERPFK